MTDSGQSRRAGQAGGRRSWWHLQRTAFFVIDYALLLLTVQAALRLSPKLAMKLAAGLSVPAQLPMESLGLPLAMAIGLQLAGVQVNQAGFRGAETLTRIVVGSAAGMACFVMLHAIIGYELIGRYVLGYAMLLGTTLVLLSRWVIWRLAEKESRQVFVLGSEAAYGDLVKKVAEQRLPIRFVGRASWHAVNLEERGRPGEGDPVVRRSVVESPAGEFVVENPDALAPADRQTLLFLMAQGGRIIDLAYFYESEFEMVHVDGLRESWFWGYDPVHARPVYFAFKRFADIALSVLGLLLAAPVAVIIALGIVLQDRGPVLYAQTRVGLGNQPFRIYKFRTMRTDAEKHGPQWAAREDGRVTFWGGILRKTRLDELPQLWNILKGDMSFVGPRPERPEMSEQITAVIPYYPYRHIIKPGLTGWAQVNYPYGASIDDARQKLAYDLYYIKYGSLTRELHIALRTIVAMVQGAR